MRQHKEEDITPVQDAFFEQINIRPETRDLFWSIAFKMRPLGEWRTLLEGQLRGSRKKRVNSEKILGWLDRLSPINVPDFRVVEDTEKWFNQRTGMSVEHYLANSTKLSLGTFDDERIKSHLSDRQVHKVLLDAARTERLAKELLAGALLQEYVCTPDSVFYQNVLREYQARERMESFSESLSN